MYQTLRNIHLFLALLSIPFLLAYGVSSVQMAHGTWFSAKPRVAETHVSASPASENARTVARELMDRYGWKGEIQQLRETPVGYKFHIARPGTVYEIDYARATGDTAVRTSTANFIGLLNRLHHAAGFWHDYWAINLWSGFVAWTSGALILLGISGVWMWFARQKDRVAGIILLVLNLGASLTLLLMIRLT